MFVEKIKKGRKILKEKGWKEFIRRSNILLKNIFLPLIELFFYPFIIYKLKHTNLKEIDELFSFSNNFFMGIIRPMQAKEEFKELINTIPIKKIKTCLEIGTARGGTLFLLSRLLNDDSIIISVDLTGWPFSGGYAPWRKLIYKAFKMKKQQIYLLNGYSQSDEIFDKIKNILADKKIDFLFIDGDHSYNGVKQDFEKYYSLMNKNGAVVFHDILLEKTIDGEEGVKAFWEELKSSRKYYTKEIIYNNNKKEFGLGVVYV